MKKVLSSLKGGAEKKGVASKNQRLMSSISLARPEQNLDPNKITIGPLIGQGGFAKVYRCELDGQSAVAKVIDSSRLNEELTYLLTNECTIWASLSHPNIISFLGMAATPAAVMLVCELLIEGSLQDALERKRKAGDPPPTAMALVLQLQQISSGMEYLHALEPPVLHRDLKSANILRDGERLAIADFGLARYQANSGKKMTAETGSYRWMAPEVIRHEEYDKRCDVYSYAILAWEMLTYRIPFDHMMPVEAAFAVAREAKRPKVPDEWKNHSIAEMLRACWHQEAKNRPPFGAVSLALAEELEIMKAEQAQAEVPSGNAAGATDSPRPE